MQGSEHVQDFPVLASVTINAPTSKVWGALTNPELAKRYLFGTNVITDWKEGAEIRWKGTWEGKSYEDKGTILEIIPEKILKTTYWSSIGGLPDKTENYKIVTYKLESSGSKTVLTLILENNPSEKEKQHLEQNWKMVLESIKKLVEQ